MQILKDLLIAQVVGPVICLITITLIFIKYNHFNPLKFIINSSPLNRAFKITLMLIMQKTKKIKENYLIDKLYLLHSKTPITKEMEFLAQLRVQIIYY